jgi:hypothetical protein
MKARTLVALAMAAGLFAAAPAGAAETVCTGTLTGLVSGNVVVPGDATCILQEAHVTGNVRVEPGGGLVSEGSTVEGNVTATGIRLAEFFSTTIQGNLNVVGDVSGGGGFVFDNSTVQGNAQVAGVNTIEGVAGRIEGNLLIRNNAGPIDQFFSFVGGNLACFGNARAIFPNPATGLVVEGQRLGQCADSP